MNDSAHRNSGNHSTRDEAGHGTISDNKKPAHDSKTAHDNRAGHDNRAELNYKKNIAALEAVFPGFTRQAAQFYTPDPDMEILPSGAHPAPGREQPEPAATAVWKGSFLHSRRDPVREASRLTADLPGEADEKQEFKPEDTRVESTDIPAKSAPKTGGPNANPGTYSAVFFYGFGLGYIVEAFLKKNSTIPAVVIEPSMPRFLRSLEARNLEHIISHPRITFLLDTEPAQVETYLNRFPRGDLAVSKVRSLTDTDPDYFCQIDEAVSRRRRRIQVNQATLKRFGNAWVRNLIKNSRVIERSRDVGELKEGFNGMPVLMAAGGPSLDEILPRIKEISRKCVIVAVDTSAYAVAKSGVLPDFLVVVDPQYWNTRHLDDFYRLLLPGKDYSQMGDSGRPSSRLYGRLSGRLSGGLSGRPSGRPAEETVDNRNGTTQTMVISESSTHPRVFSLLSGLPLFFCGSLFPLGRYLEQYIGRRHPLNAGGSVATTAWDFCRFIGGKPIYCSGLDLGFPARRTHYRGSFFEERMHLLAGRTSPAETAGYTYLFDAAPYPVPNNRGRQTLTDQRLLIYKEWFQGQLKNFSETRTRTLSLDGIAIKGIEPADVDEILSLPDIRPAIEKQKQAIMRQRQCYSAGRAPGESDSRDTSPLPDSGLCRKQHPKLDSKLDSELDSKLNSGLDTGLNELHRELTLLLKSAEQALRLTGRLEAGIENSAEQNIRRALEGLTQIDRQITAINSREIAGFLLQPLLQHAIQAAPPSPSIKPDVKEEAERVITQSRELYHGIARAAAFHIRLLEAHAELRT